VYLGCWKYVSNEGLRTLQDSNPIDYPNNFNLTIDDPVRTCAALAMPLGYQFFALVVSFSNLQRLCVPGVEWNVIQTFHMVTSRGRVVGVLEPAHVLRRMRRWWWGSEEGAWWSNRGLGIPLKTAAKGSEESAVPRPYFCGEAKQRNTYLGFIPRKKIAKRNNAHWKRHFISN
jgi:hypothetical protein